MWKKATFSRTRLGQQSKLAAKRRGGDGTERRWRPDAVTWGIVRTLAPSLPTGGPLHRGAGGPTGGLASSRWVPA